MTILVIKNDNYEANHLLFIYKYKGKKYYQSDRSF